MRFDFNEALAGGGGLLFAAGLLLGGLVGEQAKPVENVAEVVLSPSIGDRALWICEQPATDIVKVISGTNITYNAKYQTTEERFDLTWQVDAGLGSPIAVEEPFKDKGYTEAIDQKFLDCVGSHQPIPEVTAPHAH